MKLGTKKLRLIVGSLAVLLGSLAGSTSARAAGDCELQYGMCIYECVTLGGGDYNACQSSCGVGYDLCELGDG